MAWLNLREEIAAEFEALDDIYEDFRVKYRSILTDNQRASAAEWRRRNPDKVRAQSLRAYYRKRNSPDFMQAQRERARDYRLRHKDDPVYRDRKRINAIRYYQKHRESVLAYYRARHEQRKQDPAWVASQREYVKRWRKEHPEKVRAWARSRYERIKQDPEKLETLRARKRRYKQSPEGGKESRRRYMDKLKADPVRWAHYMEAKRARERRFYEQHRDEVLAKGKADRAANPDKYKAKDKAYREKHLDEVRRKERLRTKELKLRDPEAYARREERAAKWKQEHPEKVREHRRRAKRRQTAKPKQERKAA